MKIRECTEIKKEFEIEQLERKLDIIDIELDTLCSHIIISLNKNEPIDLREVKNQIREIQEFIINKEELKCINKKNRKKYQLNIKIIQKNI